MTIRLIISIPLLASADLLRVGSEILRDLGFIAAGGNIRPDSTIL